MQLTCERHVSDRRRRGHSCWRGHWSGRWMCWRCISAYLLATYAMAGAAWAIIPAANDAPHAPW